MNTFNYRRKHKTNYFEGWYVRLLGEENIAVIFGITTNNDKPHAFIQYTNSKIFKYYEFRLEDVITKDNYVQFGQNILTPDNIYIKTEDVEIDAIFQNTTKLKKSLINNSIMSFLYYLPLECYQEVIYLDGEFKQGLKTGNIYMEKTYGRKFPKEWIWIQSNSFPLTIATAKMPLLFNRCGF